MYTNSYKIEFVETLYHQTPNGMELRPGQNVTKLAENAGISSSMIHHWKKSYSSMVETEARAAGKHTTHPGSCVKRPALLKAFREKAEALIEAGTRCTVTSVARELMSEFGAQFLKGCETELDQLTLFERMRRYLYTNLYKMGFSKRNAAHLSQKDESESDDC